MIENLLNLAYGLVVLFICAVIGALIIVTLYLLVNYPWFGYSITGLMLLLVAYYLGAHIRAKY